MFDKVWRQTLAYWTLITFMLRKWGRLSRYSTVPGWLAGVWSAYIPQRPWKTGKHYHTVWYRSASTSKMMQCSYDNSNFWLTLAKFIYIVLRIHCWRVMLPFGVAIEYGSWHEHVLAKSSWYLSYLCGTASKLHRQQSDLCFLRLQLVVTELACICPQGVRFVYSTCSVLL